MTHSRSPVALVPSDGLASRLLARSTVTATGCREWNGSLDKDGYGSVHNAGKTVRAHRASFAAFVRPLRDGEEVCHRCDNPPCIEPSHLKAADHVANMADMLAKGRRRPDVGYIKGETHHQAKLTAEQVRAIRRRRAEGAKYADLVSDFGVSKTTIAQICTRKVWRDLPD